VTNAAESWNGARFEPKSKAGHYESWFVRANGLHGDAFWIRYTIFSPRGAPQDAVGELWAIAFTSKGIVAVKEEHPIAGCSFARERLDVRIGKATLDGESVRGGATANGHTIAWDLRYAGDDPPIFLLPQRLYAARFPRAKTLVNRPLAAFNGYVAVDGGALEVADWTGSQNHNWGSRHTDRYAWGQVAGFDEDPRAFLECSTARLRIGPAWTPQLTTAVLRLGDETLAFNGLMRAARAPAAYRPYEWHFETRGEVDRLTVSFGGRPGDFVALRYPNPPGGTKICLNSKVARCDVRLARRGGQEIVLHSSRAAFEILDDEAPAGVTPTV